MTMSWMMIVKLDEDSIKLMSDDDELDKISEVGESVLQRE